MSRHTGNVKRMATLTAPNRTIVAVLFLVGGALQILGAVLGFANVGNSGGFYLLSALCGNAVPPRPADEAAG